MAGLLSVGVVGTGHLGTRHAHTYARLKGVRLAAVCDTNISKARRLARKLRCEAFTDFRQMFGRVEAVSLAVPTSAHYTLGRRLLNAGIHTLIEKPDKSVHARQGLGRPILRESHFRCPQLGPMRNRLIMTRQHMPPAPLDLFQG